MAILGNGAIILALVAALFSGGAFLLSWNGRNQFQRYARLGVWATFGFLTLAILLLLISLFSHDFSLEYVAHYSSLETTSIYLVTALWAGNAGSLLFWGWLTALAGAILMARQNKHTGPLLPYAIPPIMLTVVLFIALMLIENPFISQTDIPANGVGLNPLLENAGMIFHPPALLAGFALLVIPFALGVGALIKNQMTGDWIVAARRWALAAWLLLGAGNIIGMWWAYAELGWGGYWGWDPVENAGLMPWLMLTAFLHSTMMERRRGLYKSWNFLLIIFAFNLAIFGAFLTRSDILNSVHTFGETAMGPIFLVFLAVTLLGSLGLVIWRRHNIVDEASDQGLISGENTFLFFNLLLVASTFAIWLGTMFPFFTDLFTGNRMELDTGFFHQVNIPLFILIILLGGLCVVIGWKKPDLRKLGRQLLWPAALALVTIIGLAIAGITAWYVLVSLFVVVFMLLATLTRWWIDIAAAQRADHQGYLAALRKLFAGNRGRYGGFLVHLAIAIMALGITGSSVYDTSARVTLAPGGTHTIQDYTLVYNGLIPTSATDRMVITGDITLMRGDRAIGKLKPVTWFQLNQSQWVTEVAIRSNLKEDLYVSLDDWDENQNAVFTVRVNPMVAWIWIGGLLLIIGGLVSFSMAPRKVVTDD